LCERVVAGQASIRDWKLPATTHAELLTKYIAMRLHRSGGDAEPLSDLVIRATGGDEDDHLALPVSDRRTPLSRCVRHGTTLRLVEARHH
jgi:hypothetical protein